jgi:hypothetical protein
MARFEQDRADGLADVKFFIVDGASASEEELFAAINQIDEARAKGLCKGHDTWTADLEPKPFAPLMD